MAKIQKTACFLDLDHTLFHTDEFFHVNVKNAFLRFGIDTQLWEQTYATVYQGGYTLEKHVEEIHRQSGEQLPLDEMNKVLRHSFSNLQRYVFPDVFPFLERAKKLGVILFLLSFGNPEWQTYKVKSSGLAGHFHHIFFTAKEGKKADLIVKESKGFKNVLMIDNNPLELDFVKDVAPNTQTYCINRVPDALLTTQDELEVTNFLEARKFVQTPWRHKHIPCKNLNGLFSDPV